MEGRQVAPSPRQATASLSKFNVTLAHTRMGTMRHTMPPTHGHHVPDSSLSHARQPVDGRRFILPSLLLVSPSSCCLDGWMRVDPLSVSRLGSFGAKAIVSADPLVLFSFALELPLPPLDVVLSRCCRSLFQVFFCVCVCLVVFDS